MLARLISRFNSSFYFFYEIVINFPEFLAFTCIIEMMFGEIGCMKFGEILSTNRLSVTYYEMHLAGEGKSTNLWLFDYLAKTPSDKGKQQLNRIWGFMSINTLVNSISINLQDGLTFMLNV